MRKILIIGAGKSTSYLIKYLLDKSVEEELHIIVADKNITLARKLIGDHENAQAILNMKTLDQVRRGVCQPGVQFL